MRKKLSTVWRQWPQTLHSALIISSYFYSSQHSIYQTTYYKNIKWKEYRSALVYFIHYIIYVKSVVFQMAWNNTKDTFTDYHGHLLKFLLKTFKWIIYGTSMVGREYSKTCHHFSIKNKALSSRNVLPKHIYWFNPCIQNTSPVKYT